MVNWARSLTSMHYTKPHVEHHVRQRGSERKIGKHCDIRKVDTTYTVAEGIVAVEIWVFRADIQNSWKPFVDLLHKVPDFITKSMSSILEHKMLFTPKSVSNISRKYEWVINGPKSKIMKVEISIIYFEGKVKSTETPDFLILARLVLYAYLILTWNFHSNLSPTKVALDARIYPPLNNILCCRSASFKSKDKNSKLFCLV